MASEESRQLNNQQAESLNQVLTAGSEELFQLLLTPQLELLPALLKNPQLNEDHLLALLKRRDLPEDLLLRIYQRWRGKLSHKLLLSLARNPGTPGTIISRLLPHLRLFELVDLCYLPGVTPDQRLAAEREIILRLPTTPLGNKITLARRGTPAVVAETLKEGHSALVDACLSSPRLKEAAIFQFLNSPRATAETISMIARHSRWRQRPILRLAILKHHQTPAVWFTLWLPKLSTAELRQLVSSRRLSKEQKRLVTEQLQKRKAC